MLWKKESKEKKISQVE